MEKNAVFYKTDGASNNKIGNLTQGIYPKAFDITIGITVLNENLVTDTDGRVIVTGTLNKRYFYNFSTTNGPAGGHDGFHAAADGAEPETDASASDTGVNPGTDAATGVVLGGGGK